MSDDESTSLFGGNGLLSAAKKKVAESKESKSILWKTRKSARPIESVVNGDDGEGVKIKGGDELEPTAPTADDDDDDKPAYDPVKAAAKRKADAKSKAVAKKKGSAATADTNGDDADDDGPTVVASAKPKVKAAPAAPKGKPSWLATKAPHPHSASSVPASPTPLNRGASSSAKAPTISHIVNLRTKPVSNPKAEKIEDKLRTSKEYLKYGKDMKNWIDVPADAAKAKDRGDLEQMLMKDLFGYSTVYDSDTRDRKRAAEELAASDIFVYRAEQACALIWNSERGNTTKGRALVSQLIEVGAGIVDPNEKEGGDADEKDEEVEEVGEGDEKEGEKKGAKKAPKKRKNQNSIKKAVCAFSSTKHPITLNVCEMIVTAAKGGDNPLPADVYRHQVARRAKTNFDHIKAFLLVKQANLYAIAIIASLKQTFAEDPISLKDEYAKAHAEFSVNYIAAWKVLHVFWGNPPYGS
jgi:hypothetical protein